MKRFSTGVAAVCLGLISVGCTLPARADRALVVGVNDYLYLDRSEDLSGCVNDAKSIATSLEGYGFKVTMLTDGTATKGGIVSALQKMRAEIGKDERFTFYFAGHGARGSNATSVILPSDAKDDEMSDMGTDELYKLIRAIPAKSRTVMLDSCFSGGMVRSLGGIKGLRARFHVRKNTRKLVVGANSKDLQMVGTTTNNGGTENSDAKKASGVCYFTAARGNETAGENTFNGETHGVFTYYLTQRLKGEKDRWGNVQDAVAVEVASATEDLQHPTISPAYVDKPIFEDTGKAEPEEPQNVWDIYNLDRADASKVQLSILPDKTTFAIGENIRFATKVGMEGFLLILERGTSGKVNLLFPRTGNAQDAHLSAGQQVSIPDAGSAYSPDSAGTERMKAIMFSSQEQAQKMLDTFKSVAGASWRDLQLHKVENVQADGFYTSDIIFEVQ